MSYMNKKVILTEGFFKSLFRLILSGKGKNYIRKIDKNKVVKKSGILNDIEKLNKHSQELDKKLSNYFGVEFSSGQLSLEDLINMEDK